jgi:hypothetical protein
VKPSSNPVPPKRKKEKDEQNMVYPYNEYYLAIKDNPGVVAHL